MRDHDHAVLMSIGERCSQKPVSAGLSELLTGSGLAYTCDQRGNVIGLSLANCGILGLFQEIGELAHLQTLRLFGNYLDDLSKWLPRLRQLESLYLGRNHFTKLPRPVVELPNLRVLGLNRNPEIVLGAEIRDLANLRVLGLGGNNWSHIPAQVFSLRLLEALYLNHNQLIDLPVGLEQLQHLRELNLSHNPIRELSSRLGSLRQLRVVQMSNMSMEDFPEALLRLSRLQELVLSGTRITELPTAISKLRRLRRLDVSGARLSRIPVSIDTLLSLQFLNISSIQLTSIPSQIFSLSNLTELKMGGTRVQFIPREIGKLKMLEEVDASGMGLLGIPEEIFSLPRLRRLNLAGNRLRELPYGIVQSGLPIRWKPQSAINGIFIGGNPLETPPREIASRGDASIRSYYRSLKGKQFPMHEVRVLLVGDGAAGKTSIIRRLRGESFNPLESQTHGINIGDLNLTFGDTRVVLHLWDFGGQEIMHATHQFFLSNRSVYVLVLDGRKDEKAEYWLKLISSFGDSSQIIIVLNKSDVNPAFDVNRKFLRTKYPNIRAIVRTSCLSDAGIQELSAVISDAVRRMPHVGTNWPFPWFVVKRKLEETTRDYISYTEFQYLCDGEGIDTDSQRVFVEFLNDLGVMLHFRDLPLRDTNVINPQWVTGGVYKLINSPVIAQSGGVLDILDIHTILDPQVHPHQKHGFLIELMKKFELCYQLDHARVLFPSLLPIEEPDLPIRERGALRFTVAYDLLPFSILPRLIVKLHHDIWEGLSWRSGVVLANAQFETRALVRADEVENEISIFVHGDQRRDHLAVIRSTLLEVSRSFGHLKFTELVPIPDEPSVRVSWEHLLRLERKGIQSFLPDGSDRAYEVSDLLGAVRTTRKTEEELLVLLRELRANSDTDESLLRKANDALMLQPNFFGLGLNLNAMIAKLRQKQSKFHQ